ncbi:MAG: amidohydrolase [Xanthobacteraceae bacterium]|nr:amidohydrolase [Xanthobacteraceae bacterium]
MSADIRTGIDRRTLLATAASGGVAAAAGGPVLAQAPLTPPARPAAPPPASAAAAATAVGDSRDIILRISREVWSTPELSLAEVKSSAIHIRELTAAGFQIVSTGTSGTPTAFIAEWGQGKGGPVIGYLPEYDALPGLGNAAEPRQTPAPAGATVGHGCGHNMLGAGCTGAAVALKRMMERAGTAGTIRVYGCAAEEAEGVKVYMVRDGLFNDVDAALAWHPAPVAGTGLIRTSASNKAKVMFHGRTAHAGNSPWDGRSALKAAELFAHGVNLMREHILPSARIHYIYENAGVAPNIVPDFAQMWIVIRDVDRDKVSAMTDWVRQIADGAAMATQTRAEFDLFFGMHDLLPNDALVPLVHRHMATVPLDWTADEQAFARTCQKAMKLPETGMATSLLPPLGDLTAGASTDVGDVSYVTPVGIFGWPTLPLGVSLHTWAVTACAGMSIGDKGSLNTARILAGVGFDLMTDAALRQAAKESLQRRRGDRPFVSPIPKSRTRPLGLPPHLVKTSDDELVAPLPAAQGASSK